MSNSINVKSIKIIEAEAIMFIIPNRASAPIDYCTPEVVGEKVEKICKLNGIPYHDTDKLIHVWITSPILNTENLTDHGGYFEDENMNHLSCPYDLIPVALLAGKKEGDVVKINIPATLTIMSDKCISEGEEIILQLELTLCQKGYRYRRFGEFEKVIDYVLNDYDS